MSKIDHAELVKAYHKIKDLADKVNRQFFHMDGMEYGDQKQYPESAYEATYEAAHNLISEAGDLLSEARNMLGRYVP